MLDLLTLYTLKSIPTYGHILDTRDPAKKMSNARMSFSRSFGSKTPFTLKSTAISTLEG